MQLHIHVFIDRWLYSEPNLTSNVTNLQAEYLATSYLSNNFTEKFRDDFHRFYYSHNIFQCLNQEEGDGLNLYKAWENIKV